MPEGAGKLALIRDRLADLEFVISIDADAGDSDGTIPFHALCDRQCLEYTRYRYMCWMVSSASIWARLPTAIWPRTIR